MKRQVYAFAFVMLSFGFSAHAGNNPRVDQALKDALADKKEVNLEIHHDEAEISKPQINSRYRAVEVLEMGDELGGFTSSKGLAKDLQ